jgi:Ras-related protein Rab-21
VRRLLDPPVVPAALTCRPRHVFGAAALLVFDITDTDSFARVKAWVKELRQMAGACSGSCAVTTGRLPGADASLPVVAGKDIVLVLAGNKADLERSRQVTLAEAEAYAASIGATLFSTSAKTNKGVDQAFQAIAESKSAMHPCFLTR